MIEVIMFVNGEHKDSMFRRIAPSKGDYIVIDCGEMVKVISVDHQWNDPNTIGINCVPMENKGGESET